jgi:cysteine desulfurase / selenocysteine lyase
MNQLMDIKQDFPIFKNHPGLIYLDNAATSQKPRQVISAVNDFYTKYNSNIHRGIYDLSQNATDIYEKSRQKVADFIKASDPAEIIFTGNASEALNLVACGYAQKFLQKGDIIVLSDMEHHSNFVPWLRLRDKIGLELFFIPFDKDYRLDYKSILQTKLNKNKIKLITLTHASNVLGTINPITEIINFFKENDINAKIVVDAAQSIPHISINVKKLGCDFLAFSSHKMLGPSGVGALWGKKNLLDVMDPLLSGGGMILSVSKEKVTFAEAPDKFEAGTGKLEGVAGLGAAIDYLNNIGIKNIETYEKTLTEYALKQFMKLTDFDLYGSKNMKNRLGVFAFNIKGLHPHDVGEILNRQKICVRTGHHCAQPLHQALGVSSSVRASLYIYNTKEDIDKLMEGIGEAKKMFGI